MIKCGCSNSESDMRPQNVSVDFSLMISTALLYVGLAAAGWLLLRLVQACFWLPGHLEKRRLQEMENEEKKVLLKDKVEPVLEVEEEVEEELEQEEDEENESNGDDDDDDDEETSKEETSVEDKKSN